MLARPLFLSIRDAQHHVDQLESKSRISSYDAALRDVCFDAPLNDSLFRSGSRYAIGEMPSPFAPLYRSVRFEHKFEHPLDTRTAQRLLRPSVVAGHMDVVDAHAGFLAALAAENRLALRHIGTSDGVELSCPVGTPSALALQRVQPGDAPLLFYALENGSAGIVDARTNRHSVFRARPESAVEQSRPVRSLSASSAAAQFQTLSGDGKLLALYDVRCGTGKQLVMRTGPASAHLQCSLRDAHLSLLQSRSFVGVIDWRHTRHVALCIEADDAQQRLAANWSVQCGGAIELFVSENSNYLRASRWHVGDTSQKVKCRDAQTAAQSDALSQVIGRVHAVKPLRKGWLCIGRRHADGTGERVAALLSPSLQRAQPLTTVAPYMISADLYDDRDSIYVCSELDYIEMYVNCLPARGRHGRVRRSSAMQGVQQERQALQSLSVR